MKNNKAALSTALIYALAGGVDVSNKAADIKRLNFIKDTGKLAPKAKPKFKRSKKRGW